MNRLREKDIINPDTEAHCAFHSTLRSTTRLHCHDFYEIFLITKGSIIHCVNDTRQYLQEGSLVFIRPDDFHYYQVDPQLECRYINLAFPQGSIHALFDFLGDGLAPDLLLKPKLPPTVLLSRMESARIQESLEKLNALPLSRTSLIKARLRAFLTELFTRYFTEDVIISSLPLPSWLENLCREMQKEKNFTSGLPAMLRLSGKTHEHLCRTFKKYLNLTPTEYINELRLNLTANLLLNTDKDILEASLDAGFENLSHFYHLFKRKFNSSPANYRKAYKRTAIPLKSE